MKFINALVVKLVDTKDLKAELADSQVCQSIAVQGSLKHPIKSHNFNLAFNKY